MANDIWNIEQVLGWIAWGEQADIHELKTALFSRVLGENEKPLSHWCDILTMKLREGALNVNHAVWLEEDGSTRPLHQAITKEEWKTLVLYGANNGSFNSIGPQSVVAFSGLSGEYPNLPPGKQYEKEARTIADTTGRPKDTFPHLVEMRFDAAEIKKVFRPSPERTAYEARVKDFMDRSGHPPPIQTTKRGVMGDREWATENNIPRPLIKQWRCEIIGKQRAGRPKL